MIRYLIRRILWAVVLFFAVTVVSYVLFFIIPADPAKQAAAREDLAALKKKPRTANSCC